MIRYVCIFCTVLGFYSSNVAAAKLLRETDKIHFSLREIVNRRSESRLLIVQLNLCAGSKDQNGRIVGELQCRTLAESETIPIQARPDSKTYVNSVLALDSNRIDGHSINESADFLQKRIAGDPGEVMLVLVVSMFEQVRDRPVLADRQFSALPDLRMEPDATKTLVNRLVLENKNKDLQSRVLVVVGRKQ